mmetsp:Transcript_28995/g.45078  ORF Transcript_28995/g.45078 Transcript_28995/m.45078 type:complete len:107 (+) Transcript_28995:20-340(+)
MMFRVDAERGKRFMPVHILTLSFRIGALFVRGQSTVTPNGEVHHVIVLGERNTNLKAVFECPTSVDVISSITNRSFHPSAVPIKQCSVKYRGRPTRMVTSNMLTNA